MIARPLRRERAVLLLLAVLALPAHAAVPLADRDADRQAKAAAPGSKEALIYVYRPEDKRSTALTVAVKGYDAAQLAPRTFALWRVRPGRTQVSVAGSTSTLTLAGEAGRVYYVEVGRAPSGVPVLRHVSFATGRAQVYRAQLVAQSAPVKAARASTGRASPARGAQGALMLKFGALSLDTGTTSLSTFNQQFEDSATGFGLEGEWHIRPELTLGAEVFLFSNDYTSASLGGSADVMVTLVNIKRYFALDSDWQPFIGAGIGGAFADYSGSVVGDTSGLALQAVGGVQWRRGQFALRGEVKYLSAETETDNGQQADYSGTGVFLSAGFYF